MKKILIISGAILIAMQGIVFANGNAIKGTAVPTVYHESTAVGVVMENGSMQSNIGRIAKNNGWSRVVWKGTKDYNWVGQTRVVGLSFVDVMGKILKDYPLQAVFYQGNHVLVIQPRTLK
jgi:LEA14-like dessication related protein